MPAELRPSPDFFTDVRRILADARRTAYTANFPKSRNPTTQCNTLLPKLPSGEVSISVAK